MEVPGKKKSTTANKNANICDPCDDNDETEIAESYCIDCNEFLCKGCAKAHRKSKLSRHHELLGRDKMPKKRFALSSDNVCSRHDGKALEYLCYSHSETCCATCVTIEHRNCKLEYLSKKAEGFEDGENYRALTERIHKVKQRIFQAKEKVKIHQDRAISNHLNFLEEIQEFKNYIETVVKAVEDSATDKAKAIQGKNAEELDSFSTRSDELAEEMDDMIEELDHLRASKQQSQLFLAAKQVETKIDTIETKLAEIETKTIVRQYKFRRSDIMNVKIDSWRSFDLLEIFHEPTSSNELTKDESKIGSDDDQQEANYETTEFITKTQTGFSQKSGASASFEPIVNRDITNEFAYETAESFDSGPPVHAYQTNKTVGLKKIYIRHKRDTNDSGCLIAGMQKLTHSKLLLTDYNNHSLKIVDVTYQTIVSYMKLACRPWDIALVGNDRVVVSCYDKLIFFRVDEDLIKTKEVDVKGHCSGVASQGKDLFVTFTAPRPCLKIFNTVGTVLRTIPKNPWTDIFTYPNFVIPCSNDKEVIVSDGERGLLTIQKNESINTYKENILRTPFGMTPGRTGTIFVAGRDSNNVVEISEPPKARRKTKMKVIVPEIDSPLALVYNKATERLYISHGNVVSNSNDYLSVFQL